jgi:putative polyhydroxyalkanoate system protein
LSHILIERSHALGLPAARRLARRWMEKAARDHALQCRFEEGPGADRLHFSRSGVMGTLDVTAERFRVELRLGLLMSVFAPTIEAKLTQKLDQQIEKAHAATPPA